MVLLGYRHMFKRTCAVVCVASCLSAVSVPLALADSDVSVSLNRSSLVVLPTPMKEIMISNPDIADIHAHNSTTLSVIGKRVGHTNVRIFDSAGKVLRSFDVAVGYDMPAIRKSLKAFLPDENISVEMVNTSVALTGNVHNSIAAEKAVKIVRDFLGGSASNDFGVASTTGSFNSASSASADTNPEIMNLLKVTSGQQVMLRVRVGEMNRVALKRLGIDPQVIVSGNNFGISSALGSGISGLAVGATGPFTLPASGTYRGVAVTGWTNGQNTAQAAMAALERDGLFKLLAEPNLVAVSGEEAEFLAGGEIPIPVAQSSSGGSTTPTISVEYKPYGVAVKFTPDVISENHIRLKVNPEVSEIDLANGVTISGTLIPAISSRRVKTTVELAPGESFMLAGLLKDTTGASIEQIPGAKDLPILGALFRSTEFKRNETELVIAVTPYLVDPMKSSDVKMPTDNFAPASQAEMFFYGALGAISGNGKSVSQTYGLEGPTGFMVD